MEVTEVSRVRGKVQLVIGGERILITRRLYEERPLQVGDEVDLEEYDRFLLLNQYRPALEYAVSLLAGRPRSTGELEAGLRRVGYRPQTIEMVLYKLSSNGLLDDEAFARQWAAARSGAGLGKQRIAMDLRRKGLSGEQISEALENLDEDTTRDAALELARKFLRKKKPDEDGRKVRQRAIAALARRGYGYEEAKEAVARAEEE